MDRQQRGPAVAGMSNFVDWLLTSGTARVTLVTGHKANAGTLVGDFYRPIRERLIAAAERPPEHDGLDDYIAVLGDEKAKKIFPLVVAGWRKFAASGARMESFKPPRVEWPVGPGVSVEVNPELGLRIDGEPHLVKLYLRGEPLSQRRVDLTIAVMRNALQTTARLAVLDVRTARLRLLGKGAERPADQLRLRTLLRAEGAGYATAYASV